MIKKDDLTQDLETLYSKISSEGQEAILKGQEKIDLMLNQFEHDHRLGLTLLISLQSLTTNNLQNIIEEIHRVEPEQYFYPISDLHVTILDLVSATEEFNQNDARIPDLVRLVENTVNELTVFEINFKGIIAGNAAILAKGFYGYPLLQLRNQLRKNALARNIELNERYQSLSAHSTIVRFKSTLQHREMLWATIQKYHDFEIGVFKVNELDLVIHDWYNRKKKIIKKFILKD